MKISVRNFQSKVPVDPERIKQAIRKVISCEEKKKTGEITVIFVSDAKIRELNLKYLHRDAPTDVLSFDPGDIVVSADTAARNAGRYRTSPAYELKLYAVHGLLHLLGYSDSNPRQARLMRKKEKQYVNT